MCIPNGRSSIRVPLSAGEGSTGYAAAVIQLSDAELDELVAGTVDAYDGYEQLTGLFTMIEEHVALPFDTTVLGVEVTVRDVSRRENRVVAVCHCGRLHQAIDVRDLPLPDPAPEGVEWIAAYQHWTAR